RPALSRHDAGERPLLPALVGQADDGGLQHVRVAHDQVLELDARDPLAAALDDVLRPIRDLHVAVGVDRHHVAGTEPTVVERLRRASIIVVGRGDPRPAYLELADAGAVPRQRLAGVVHHADLHAGERWTLLRTQAA